MRGKKRFVFLCSIALAISVGLGVQRAFTPNDRVVATAEQTAVEVKSLRAHYYHNHTFDEVGAEGKYSLVLHVCPSMTEDDVLPFDKSFGEGNFEEQIGLYSMNGEKIEEANLSVNFDTDYAIGDVVGSTGGIHLVYDNPNGLFDKRISEYVELKIPQGTTVYNATFYKDFSLYFFNGKWMTHKPLVNYEVELENLPTYTIGELVEVEFASLHGHAVVVVLVGVLGVAGFLNFVGNHGLKGGLPLPLPRRGDSGSREDFF